MNNLPTITDLDVAGKKILVRADLDVGEKLVDSDDSKLLTNKRTIEHLVEKGAKVTLISHRGRPEGKVDGNLSLLEVAQKLSQLISKKIDFVHDIVGHETKDKLRLMKPGEIICLENLRFDPREENNDENFAKSFAELFDIYINDAFSSSAKEHSSIVGIPKYLPHALGFHFLNEIENLSKVLNEPKRPVVVIISGVKKDKLEFVEPFSKFADKILIGGRLPEIVDARDIGKSELDAEFKDRILRLVRDGKVIIADLIQDKEDITLHSVERFENAIVKAGTIVVGGPLGKFEDEGHRQGTKRVFEAVVQNKSAFKVAGGGDTEQAIELLGLAGKFDWISVGGGASLEFLAKGTLLGIEAQK